MDQETVTEMATRASLPVTVSGMTFFDVSLPIIVQVITAIYVTLMAVDKGYTMYRKYKGKQVEPEE